MLEKRHQNQVKKTDFLQPYDAEKLRELAHNMSQKMRQIEASKQQTKPSGGHYDVSSVDDDAQNRKRRDDDMSIAASAICMTAYDATGSCSSSSDHSCSDSSSSSCD